MSEPIENKVYNLEFSGGIHYDCSLSVTPCDNCSDKLWGRYYLRSVLFWIDEDLPFDPWESPEFKLERKKGDAESKNPGKP